MGWLFAVALGIALSIWLAAAAVLAMGAAIDPRGVRIVAGVILLLWAAYHALYGHRHRVRVGMTTGLAGLALWSFMMATAHGAGLMLLPALMPLCTGLPVFGKASLLVSLAAVGLHTLATLIVTGAVALLVYDWLGLAFLRRGWINFDLLWGGALALTGVLLIAVG